MDQTAARICLACLVLQPDYGPVGPPEKDPIPSSSGSFYISESPVLLPFKTIFPYNNSTRRDELCFKFGVSILENPPLHKILPPEHHPSRERHP